MRRLLVMITAFIIFSPLAVAAQDATPAAGDTGFTVVPARTETRYVVPFTPDGLNPSLTVSSTTEGACSFDSTIATDRPDAWACTTDGGVIDPCFENAFLPEEDATEVACLETPWSTEVVMLTLTAPLTREKEGPDALDAAAVTAEETLHPWALPWALELANGDRCSLLHGTELLMAGEVVHYGCDQGGLVLGETMRVQPVWTVTYLGEGELASELVDVLTAWT